MGPNCGTKRYPRAVHGRGPFTRLRQVDQLGRRAVVGEVASGAHRPALSSSSSVSLSVASLARLAPPPDLHHSGLTPIVSITRPSARSHRLTRSSKCALKLPCLLTASFARSCFFPGAECPLTIDRCTCASRNGVTTSFASSGVQAARYRTRLARLRHVPGTASGCVHHPIPGACLGTTAPACSTRTLGEAIELRTRICTSSQCHRPTHRGPLCGIVAVSTQAGQAVSVLR